MAPVDASFIIHNFNTVSRLYRAGKKATKIASVVAANFDGGISWAVESVLEWIIELLMEQWCGELLVAALIILEYWQRNSRKGKDWDWNALRSALCLKNHCGNCGMKGHNRQNCDDNLADWMASRFDEDGVDQSMQFVMSGYSLY